MKVFYHGSEYYLISRMGETVEIAPTPHGAGSIVVHVDFVRFDSESGSPAYYDSEGGSMWKGFDKGYC